MTEKQKQIVIVAGVVILAILLFLFWGKKNQIVDNQGTGYTIPMVPASQLGDIIIGGGGPIAIPGLNLDNPDLQIIGSCCADCASPRPLSYLPAVTNIYNQAPSGPNIYNYTPPQTSTTLYGNWS